MRVYIDPSIRRFKCRACGAVFEKLTSRGRRKFSYCPNCERLQGRYRYLRKKPSITQEELEEYKRLRETLKSLGINVK